MRPLRFLALTLAILAIFYAAYDYSAGHLDESPCDIIVCPLCASYASIEFIPGIDSLSFAPGPAVVLDIFESSVPLPPRGAAFAKMTVRGPPCLSGA